MQRKQQRTTAAARPTFRQWYETEFKKVLPIYLRNDVKKELMAEYLKVHGLTATEGMVV